MNCESVRQIINEYIDGELNELESRRVELHIAACESCAREERQLRIVCNLVGTCGIQKAPEGLLNGIHIELSKQLPLRKKRSYVGAMALAASFMIALAGGYYFNVFNIQYEPSAQNQMVADAGSQKLNSDSRIEKTVATGIKSSANKESQEMNYVEESNENNSVAAPAPEPTLANLPASESAVASRVEQPSTSDIQTPSALYESEPEIAPTPLSESDEEEMIAERTPAYQTPSMARVNGAINESSEGLLYASAASMDDSMNESDRARANMVRAIDDMENGEIVYNTSRLSSTGMGAQSPRYIPAPARARSHELSAVSYNIPSAYEYYEAPSDTDVIDYVISRNIEELRRTRGNNLYARGKDVFVVKNAIASSLACERIISESIGAGSATTLQRKDNFIVVKGSFAELMPLRINILDKCSEDTPDFTQEQKNELIAAATSTYQFSPEQPTILEIQFKQ